MLIACDGIHSAVRAQFYPDEGPFAYRGINLWRGVTRQPAVPHRREHRPHRRAAFDHDHLSDPRQHRRAGNQLVNWVAEIEREVAVPVDWNKPGRLEDFLPTYQDWMFDWIDVPAHDPQRATRSCPIRWSTATRSRAGASSA